MLIESHMIGLCLIIILVLGAVHKHPSGPQAGGKSSSYPK